MEGIKNIERALARWTVPATDTGLATAGTNTTLTDTLKDWPVNRWTRAQIHIIKANGAEYLRDILSNTATQLTFNPLPGGVTVAAGDIYTVSDPKAFSLQGLVYYGKVTTFTNPTNFASTDLAGLGDGKFAGATPYQVFVLRDAGGAAAAPQGEMQPVTAYVSATGGFTHVAFSAPLAVDDEVLILHPNIATIVGIATILTRIGDPSAHILTSLTAKWGNIARSLDLILGARWDAAGDLGTDIAAILAAIGAVPGTSQGLFYYGVVTGVPGANQFTIATLVGLGDAKFADVTAPYRAFVMRDAGGAAAAPQGEQQNVTAYVSATGTFTTNAFTAAVAVGDEIILLHPRLAEIATILTQANAIRTQTDKLAGVAPVSGIVAANWQAGEQNLVSIGANDTKNKLHSLLIDINALAGTITVRLYMQINNVERRVYQQAFTVAADGPGLWIVNGTVGIHEVLRVTLQSNNAADNGQNVAYDYMLEAM